MSHTSNSSSSSTSEDEEEKKKIAAAVCDSSLFQLFDKNRGGGKCQGASSDRTGSRDGMSAKGSVPLKSNRPTKDQNDDDKNNVLHTTPEFRAHVAKQLSAMLESKLDKTVDDGVWRKPAHSNQQESGIKLFSDSPNLFKLTTPTPDHQEPSVETPTRLASKRKRRKVRLSTSSSESEDEKIRECVRTVDDIQRETEIMIKAECVTAKILHIKDVQPHKEKSQHNIGTADYKVPAKATENGQSEFSGAGGKKKKRKKKKKKKVDGSEASNSAVPVDK